MGFGFGFVEIAGVGVEGSAATGAGFADDIA